LFVNFCSLTICVALETRDSAGHPAKSTGTANETEDELTTVGNVDKDERPRFRRPKSGKRFMAKSEPAGQVGESMDGTQDSDSFLTSSAETQPLLASSQRVSGRSGI
jgi:hypothetical protein